MIAPIVSVIMGTYNSDFQKLQEAIQSIKEQTFTDWEFIICDDASTNGTYEKLQQLVGGDARFILLKNQKNRALAVTLNKCLKYTKGEYVARMDDDDYSYPERFKEEIELFENNKNIVIISSNVHIYDGIKIIGCRRNIEFPKKEDFLWGSPFVHPATMFRREAILDVGGYGVFRTKRSPEDYDLFMRLYYRGYMGMNIQKPLLRYFVNPVAMKKRKYAHAIAEAGIRYNGFKDLGILFPIGWLYVLKPLFVRLIPNNLLFKYQKTRLK